MSRGLCGYVHVRCRGDEKPNSEARKVVRASRRTTQQDSEADALFFKIGSTSGDSQDVPVSSPVVMVFSMIHRAGVFG